MLDRPFEQKRKTAIRCINPSEFNRAEEIAWYANTNEYYEAKDAFDLCRNQCVGSFKNNKMALIILDFQLRNSTLRITMLSSNTGYEYPSFPIVLLLIKNNGKYDLDQFKEMIILHKSEGYLRFFEKDGSWGLIYLEVLHLTSSAA